MSHETNNILIPIILIPIKQKSFRFLQKWDCFNQESKINDVRVQKNDAKVFQQERSKKILWETVL